MSHLKMKRKMSMKTIVLGRYLVVKKNLGRFKI